MPNALVRARGRSPGVVPWSKPFLVAGSISLIFFSLTCPFALGEQTPSPAAQDSTLPDSPQPAQTTGLSAPDDSLPTGLGAITGTVFDVNHDVLVGAQVILTGQGGFAGQTVESGGNGE